MPARVDLVALHPEEYAAGRVPRLVPVAPARFLTLDGEGAVLDAGFTSLAASLRRLLRVLRERARDGEGKDFRLPPLEALLGERLGPGAVAVPDGPSPFKLLFRVPAFVRPSDLAAVAPGGEPAWPAARIEELREGRCLQSLHAGAVATVGSTVDRLRRTAVDHALEPRGRLHLALLSDPTRTPPTRARTLVRVPVKDR